jgi:hypothetical protein
MPIHIATLDEIKQYATSEAPPSRIILIPPYDDTTLLVEQYMEQLDPAQHIIHCPTVYRDIETLYIQLHQGQPVAPERTALLLAILTSMGSYWGLAKSESRFLSPASSAAKVGILWLRTTMDVLEHARRSASASLDLIQANVLLFFLVYHIDGST